MTLELNQRNVILAILTEKSQLRQPLYINPALPYKVPDQEKASLQKGSNAHTYPLNEEAGS